MSDFHDTAARVTLIKASAEEIRNGGAGMEIRWGTSDSPFGRMFLAQSPRGITHLSFFDSDESESLETLRKDWPSAGLVRDDGMVRRLAGEIFSGKNHGETTLHVKGTAFQNKIWRSLLDIPEAGLSTYSRIAAEMGIPGASRAIGNAVGANRISLLIPCHRVIRADGQSGGYRWGLERKKAMLAREGALIPLER